MKIKLFLSIIVLTAAFMPLKAHCAVSVDKTITEEYMLNSGYSEQVYDTVQVSRARALGESYYGRDETRYKKSNRFVRFWKRLYAYTDPSSDDYSFYHHDVKTGPSYSDL